MAESVCPPRQALAELAAGRLLGGAAAELRVHTDKCKKCTAVIQKLSDLAAGAAAKKELSFADTVAGPATESSCPPRDSLSALASGKLGKGAAAELRAHTDKCEKCTRYLKGLDGTNFGADAGNDIALSGTLAQSDLEDDVALSGTMDSAGPGGQLVLNSPFIAEFRLVRALGQGAMGQVFLAQDTFLDRMVALKFLTASEWTPAARERFFVEARAVARLQHPNVVTLYRAGEEQGKRYLVSELVRGQSLEELKKPLPSQKVFEIALGISRGLALAHQRGVLHRDIKPANTMLTEAGEVKILDFGLAKLMESSQAPGDAEKNVPAEPESAAIAALPEAINASTARLTRTGVLLGTPLYMAPEIWDGDSATARSDVYSLGGMLYELCTGHPPYDAETMAELRIRIKNEDAKPLAIAAPTVDARLAAIIERCLSRDPSRRFASGVEVRNALEQITARAASLSRRVMFAGLSALTIMLVTLSGVALWRDRQAKKQAVLAQQLGQEIKDMEWTLRSARQMPLHDLNREKGIVRKRMKQLESNLLSYGTLGQGLAHYALGRGHLALQEYPQALSQLRQAMELGYQGADAYYALGLVLGKHFEQALSEVRVAGSVNWQRSQIKKSEPQFLFPAIDALKRSRQMKAEAPEYLEALIAYYQRDYDAAQKHAAAAAGQAPWLYEAYKLVGDVHMERAWQARDNGRVEEGAPEFNAAVASYDQAAQIGQSDAEVYEGLAKTLARKLQMDKTVGKSADAVYAAAVAASDKLKTIEPESISSSIATFQIMFASMVTPGSGSASAERVQKCLSATDRVLSMVPGHPFASAYAADCLIFKSELAGARGEDPLPYLRQGIALLEPAVRSNPEFFTGLNDLGILYANLAIGLQKHGSAEADAAFRAAMKYGEQAAALDRTSFSPLELISWIQECLVLELHKDAEIQALLSQGDKTFGQCMEISNQNLNCHINYFAMYARAAWRAYQVEQDSRGWVKKALEVLDKTRKLGGTALDLEQHAMLTFYLDAATRARGAQDPGPALQELEEAAKRCLAITANDAMCLTLAAQAEWVRAEWLTSQGKLALPSLQAALTKALLATQSPEAYADAWQTLAESHLRLSRVEGTAAALREQHLIDGLAAAKKGFAINPTHAIGLATHAELLLLRSQSERDVGPRQAAAREAIQSSESAIKREPRLEHRLAASLNAARALASPLGQ